MPQSQILKPDTYIEMYEFTDMSDLCRQLDEQMKSQIHERCFIGRLDGRFKATEIHSVWPVERPMRRLMKLLDGRNVTLKGITGTLVGVRCPEWAEGKNFVGWHFHFYQKDHEWGGHVNQVSGDQLTGRFKICNQIRVHRPSLSGLKFSFKYDIIKNIKSFKL